MLDTVLANALEGFTIIEDDTEAVGEILANQMGAYAEAAGKRVVHLSITEGGLALLGDEAAMRRPPLEDDELRMSANQRTTQQLLGLGKRYVVRDDEDYDFAIVDGLSVYLYDKTVREVIDVVRQITAQLKQNRSFMVPLQSKVIGERTSSYLRAQADSVIVIRTEITADRVLRSLQLQKMRNSYPSDKLVKFTLDENGIQVDTREFLG